MSFDITDQLLIREFAFVSYWIKMGEHLDSTSATFVDFKKAFDSGVRKVLYNILSELCIAMKPIR